MYQLSVGVVIGSADLLNLVRASVADLPVRIVLEQRDIGEPEALIGKLERVKPDALLLHCADSHFDLQEFIRRVKATSVSPKVVVVNATAEPETILRAVRAGADEYLYPPLEDDLRAAIERMSADRAKSQAGTTPRGKVFAFVSSKGGNGATTLACHIGMELHRQTNLQVLLADFDLDSGVLGFILKAQTRYSVLDALANANRLDPSLWKALVSNGRPGIEVLAAPSTPGQGASIPLERFGYVIPFVRAMYDWAILDFGRGLSPALLSVLGELDDLWLVTTLDIPALHQTKQMVETALQSGLAKHRLHILLNRTPRRMDITLDELDRMLGAPIYATIPSDYAALQEAYTEGRLLDPNSALGRHFGRVAGRISGVPGKSARTGFFLFR